jgi:hypothetical protein
MPITSLSWALDFSLLGIVPSSSATEDILAFRALELLALEYLLR